MRHETQSYSFYKMIPWGVGGKNILYIILQGEDEVKGTKDAAFIQTVQKCGGCPRKMTLAPGISLSDARSQVSWLWASHCLINYRGYSCFTSCLAATAWDGDNSWCWTAVTHVVSDEAFSGQVGAGCPC